MASKTGRIGEGPLGRRRVLPLALLSIVSSIILSTCGLESVNMLYQPGFYSNAGQIILTHNTANGTSSGLKGYQIYYRVFDGPLASTAADPSRQAIETAISSSTATPESSLAALQSAGYVPIAAADGGLGPNGTSPLFMVSSSELGNPVQYTLYLNEQSAVSTSAISTYVWDGTTGGTISVNDFSLTSTNYAYWYFNRTFPQATPSPSTFKPQLVNIAINRTQSPTLSSQSKPVSFESSYSSGDPDYAGAGAGSGNTIWFVFFALAYGVDTSSASFGNLYSQPVSLYVSMQYKIP